MEAEDAGQQVGTLHAPGAHGGGWTLGSRLCGRPDGVGAKRGGAGERAEVSNQIEVGWRNQRAEPREQRDRLEDKALDATAGALELHGRTSVWQALEALFRNGWASQMSAEPFQALWLVGRDYGGRMQCESVLLSAERVRPPRPNRWPCGLADRGGGAHC